MTRTLREFDSVCRGTNYTYKLVETLNEYRLESYKGGIYFERICWTKTAANLESIQLACDDIELRKYE